MAPEQRETRFEEMKRYVRFGDDDSARLARLHGPAAPHFAAIAEAFYDRTREHEAAHAVFASDEQIERLKRSLVRWMDRALRGPHDEAYYRERLQIGRVHVKIGLPQRYMFTAMALLRAAFDEQISGLRAEDQAPLREALCKLLDLELAIMLESYNDSLLERVERAETQRREALARALERSERRYIDALELAPVLAFALDRRGFVTLCNRAAEHATGYARDEVLGADFFELLLPAEVRDEERARALRWHEEEAVAADGPEGAPWELPLRARSGRLRTVRFRAARVAERKDPGNARVEDGAALFLLGEDVTDARDLMERTLRSEKLAAVGTLAAGLAHEIRNPLNGALLHLTLLDRAIKRGESGRAQAQEAVGVVVEEIKRLSALVKDFLVFARPNPPRLAPTPLSAVCRRAVTVASQDAANAKVTIETEFPPSAEVPVPIDAEKIEQVVLNLVRNAVDAVGSTGGGAVQVRTKRRPRNVDIEVEDEGPGLPSPDAPIFDAFFSTKETGTGLGLAIVQRIVDDHGGAVQVESRPGRTLFRVSLPLSLEG